MLYTGCDRNAAGPYTNGRLNDVLMDAAPQSTQVIKSLRAGDLVGHRQRPERQYEVNGDERCLLAVRFIAWRDVVVPF